MKITLRIQYQGGRARELAQQKHDQSTPPRYLKDLQNDLDRFSIPPPHSTIPVWLTGFVMCRWEAPRDSELHKAIRHGLREACRSQPSLDRRLIRYMLYQDDDDKLSTSHSIVFRSPTSVGFNTLLHMPGSPSRGSSILRSTFIKSSPPALGKAVRTQTSISIARKTRFSSPISGVRAPYVPPSSSKLGSSHLGQPLSANAAERLEHPVRDTSETSVPSVEVLDAAEQTLRRLSASTAVQDLLRKSGGTETVEVKKEPTSPVRPTFAPPTGPRSSIRARPPGLLRRMTDRAPVVAKAEFVSAPAVPMFSPSTVASMASSNGDSDTRNVTATPASSASSFGQDSHALTRELWGIRREMTALKAREDSIVQELRRLRVLRGPDGGPPDVTTDTSDALTEEIRGLRIQLRRESVDRHAAQSALHEERRKRIRAESIADDCRRECTAPFVVPAVVDAFVKLSQLSGDVVAEAERDNGSTSASRR